MTERFAATVNRADPRLAVARTAVTMMEAVTIAFVATTLHSVALLTRHPELLLTQIWCVVVLSRYLSVRFLEERGYLMSPRERQAKARRAALRDRPSATPLPPEGMEP